MTRFPETRLRRLRQSAPVRNLVRETSLSAQQLVLPMFVREDLSEPAAIGSMPGVVQHSLDSLRRAAADAAETGIGGVMLFGIPEVRDADGSGADDPEGILNVATSAVAAEVGKPRAAGSGLTPALQLIVSHFAASGGMLLRAEDPTNLRLAAQIGEVWDEDRMSKAFMERTYAEVFRYGRPAMVGTGELDFPGSVM